MGAAQESSPIAPVADGRNAEKGQKRQVADGRNADKGQKGQDLNIPVKAAEASLGQADLLLLAAEAASKSNPARDAALELLADNSFDAILITDVRGSIAYSNKAFTKLTGYDQTDVIGKSPKLLQGPGTDQKVLKR